MLIVIANPGALEENIDRVLKSWIELGFMKPEEAEERRGLPLSLYGDVHREKRRFFAIKNAAFFAMSVMTAARGLGLETHPMDGFDEDLVKKEFRIPENRIIPLLIAIGHPKPGLSLGTRAFRRELDEFVKYENYE